MRLLEMAENSLPIDNFANCELFYLDTLEVLPATRFHIVDVNFPKEQFLL